MWRDWGNNKVVVYLHILKPKLNRNFDLKLAWIIYNHITSFYLELFIYYIISIKNKEQQLFLFGGGGMGGHTD